MVEKTNLRPIGPELTPDLKTIRSVLGNYQAQFLALDGGRQAAVSMLLREGPDAEVLLIQRAFAADDPWSGQMAFPGGMQEKIDDNSRAAAERETLEEINVDLQQHAYIGQLDDLQGRHAGHPLGIVVSAHVYQLTQPVDLRPNYEVADLVWAPLSVFLDHRRSTEIRHPRAPEQIFAGVVIDENKEQIVWGLTRRFLESFFQIFDIPHLP